MRTFVRAMKKNIFIYLGFALVTFLFHTAKATASPPSDWLDRLDYLKKQDLLFDKQNSADSVLYYIEQLIPVFKEGKDYYHYFEYWRYKINILAIRGDWTTAVNEATVLNNEAKNINHPIGIATANCAIGDTYFYLHTFDKALKFYETALSILKQTSETEELQRPLLIQIIYNTVFSHNTEKSEEYIRQLEALQIAPEKQYPADVHKDICLAIYYTSIRDREKAQYWFYKARKENFINHSSNAYIRLLSATGYYNETFGNEKEALAAYNKVLSSDALPVYQYLTPLEKRAGLYEKAGDSLRAYYDYRRSFLLKDSIYKQSYTRQLGVLLSENQTNQIELEEAKDKNQAVSTITITIVLIFLLSIMAFIHFRKDSKRLKAANKKKELAIQDMERSIHSRNLYLNDISQIVKDSLTEMSKDCHMLKEGKETDTNKTILCNSISNESTMLLKQINDLLNASNVCSNFQQLVFEKEDLISLCNDAIRITEKNLNNSHILLQCIPEEKNSFPIETDRVQLMQVLVSLITMVRRNTFGEKVILSLQEKATKQTLITINGTDCRLQERNLLDITLTNSLLILQKLNGNMWIGESSYRKMCLYIELFLQPNQTEE